MLAEDVEPNRLSIAKLDVEDFLDAALGDRIGLIAFSGSAQIESPLTTDYDFFRSILRKIDVTTVQTSGTVIGDAIRLALERFGITSERSQAILLVTDGEDHDSLPLEAARNASEAGVPIFVVAIGNLQGAKIPVLDASGRRSYKTFDGETIVSKPDVDMLREIATISGGRFYYADSQLNLEQVYRESVNLLSRSELSENNRVQHKNLYQPFLATGLLAFVLYYLTPTHRSPKNRRRNVFISLFFIAAVSSFQLCFSNDSINTEPTDSSTQVKSKRNANSRKDVKDYNNAMKLFEQGKRKEVTSLLMQLADSQNKNVASSSNYNLGVESLSKALKTSADLPSSIKQNQQTEIETANDKDETHDPSEIIIQYNEERAKRDALRKETSQAAQESSRRFTQVSPKAKLGNISRNNAEIVANWSHLQQGLEQEREMELRAERLNSPSLRLNWLQTELDQYIKRLEDIDSNPPTTHSFQSMFDSSKSLTLLEEDVNAISDGMKSSNVDSQQLPGTGNSPGAISTDSAGMAKIESAKQEFIKLDLEAATLLSQYNSKRSRQVLRGARNQLDIIGEVPISYPDLVTRVARDEEQETKTKTVEKLSHYTEIPIESYYWNRSAFLNSVDEFERKARAIIDSSNSNDDFDWVFEEPLENSNSLAEGTSANQSQDEQTNNLSAIEPTQTPDKRILESAKIALRYESELHALINQTLQLLGTDTEQCSFLDIQQSKTIATNQERTLQIMREIVRPLQDNQQNNHNQQDQSNDQNSQDQNKSDQNSQEKQDKSSTSQNQPEDKTNEEKSQEEDKESHPNLNEEERRQEDSNKSESQNKTEEPTQEQKEAEALIRQVERRQKDAEEQRKFIQQALRKREKTRKDW
ncbi:MAG: VWA domain-containing protein [Thermoguttaceae bacterium]|nr:VWA domain-containing protein [Thermoguttaceae bacterium]